MSPLVSRPVLVCVCGLLTSCVRPTDEEERAARQFLQSVARGEPIPREKLDSSLLTPQSSSTFSLLQDELQGVDADSATVVWYGVLHSKKATLVTFDFAVTLRHGPSLARVVLQRGEAPVLAGLHIRRLSNEPVPRTPARSAGKVIILIALVLAPIISIIALVRLWRAPAGRKWPWALFILAGFGKASVGWTTGRFAFQPISFQVLSASGFQAPTGEWVLAASLPLGAIVYLLRSRRGARAIAETSVQPPGSEPPTSAA